ncbi:MAG: competence/damage-inducible protein A [Candidatus Aminicenantia bacterium]
MKKEIKAEIIAIGSELLTPYRIDTNSLYLTEKLNDLGIEVVKKTIVGDNEKNITQAINQALSRACLIIACGGLGPTEDDLTRLAFSKALNRKLIFHREILTKIEERFQKRGLIMPSINERQAYILDGAEVLENEWGTAPGMWIEEKNTWILILPGPPNELKSIFEKFVLPKLKRFPKQFVCRKSLKIAGLTESQTESLISDLYQRIKNLQVSLLAFPGQIEIQIIARSDKSYSQAEKIAQTMADKFIERLKENVFSNSDEELEEVVGKLLKKREETLTIAESCTGGYLGHRITNISGSSCYFERGIISYSNQSKIEHLEVSKELIEKFGAVSQEVAEAMATGVRKLSRSTYGLAITGIAGPTGGTPEKPVGLVHIALSWEDGLWHTKNYFFGNRESIKFQSTQKALDMLRRHLLKESGSQKQEARQN